jgi:hypothetical protein
MMNHNKNIAIAHAYYTAMAEKNNQLVEKYLHPEVHLIGPYGQKVGKEAVFEAAKKFMHMFKSIKIHSEFGSDDHVAISYDLVGFGESGTTLRAASLMTFKDGLIVKNELFFDTRSL